MRRNRTAARWVQFAAFGAATTLALTACASGTPTEEPATADA